MKDIVFVCTGNTCRSPMAEGLAKAKLADQRKILSRGIAVSYEDVANDKAVEAMKEIDIDITDHISKQFDPVEVTDNMMVLTMTTRHKHYILSKYPELEGRVETLLLFSGLGGDVVDPYGYNYEAYVECRNQIGAVIDRLIQDSKI